MESVLELVGAPRRGITGPLSGANTPGGKPGRRTLVLGAAGGVAGATLALVAGHPLGRALLGPNDELLLLDRVEPERRPVLPQGLEGRARWLPPCSLESEDQLAALLREHHIDEVIELAMVGTRGCLIACAAHGASYLSTAYDIWARAKLDDEFGGRSMLRARELFAPPDIDAGTHVLCMGMNPGLINLLVEAAIQELARRCGRPPSLDALELHAIVFSEDDGTVRTPSGLGPGSSPELAPPLAPPLTFSSTWSPEACLEELLEPAAMITRNGELATLDHRPHEALYAARCGDRDIQGHLVPHEELVTLGAMYPSVEIAYVYKLARAAAEALATAPERGHEEWATTQLYPPHDTALQGYNELGVLLCSRSLGELWLGWRTDMDQALALGTNAVLLQVGAGVVAGWTALREHEPGIWLPEDLDRTRTLGIAESILGPLRSVWDPRAPARDIAARRV